MFISKRIAYTTLMLCLTTTLSNISLCGNTDKKQPEIKQTKIEIVPDQKAPAKKQPQWNRLYNKIVSEMLIGLPIGIMTGWACHQYENIICSGQPNPLAWIPFSFIRFKVGSEINKEMEQCNIKRNKKKTKNNDTTILVKHPKSLTEIVGSTVAKRIAEYSIIDGIAHLSDWGTYIYLKS
jgi:hypothetical protein